MIKEYPFWYASYKILIDEGYSQNKASKVLGVPRITIYKFLKSLESENIDTPVIGFLDIETAPHLAYSFGRWKQFLSQDSIEKEGFILCASWRFSSSNEIHSVAIETVEDMIDGNDSKILESLYDFFEKCDIVVAHNGKRFDIPMIKTRLLAHGFPPVKNVKVIDTLSIARSQFRFPSNKLDSICAYLGLGRKLGHDGISLWIRCLKGDKDAMQEMVEYNKYDVVLLEMLYYKLRAWDNQHPVVSTYYADDELRCSCCGSENIKETGNYIFSPTGKFTEFVCGDCGKRSKLQVNLLSKTKRKNILRNS